MSFPDRYNHFPHRPARAYCPNCLAGLPDYQYPYVVCHQCGIPIQKTAKGWELILIEFAITEENDGILRELAEMAGRIAWKHEKAGTALKVREN